MTTFNYIIQDENGIHARPAGLMVKEVKSLTSKFTLTCKGKTAEMTKLFAIMGLAVKKGDEITVTVEGDNAQDDAVILENFIRNNF